MGEIGGRSGHNRPSFAIPHPTLECHGTCGIERDEDHKNVVRLFRLWQRNCVSLNGLPATQNGALKTLRKIVGLDEGSRRQRGGTRKPKLILDETPKGIQKALT